MDDFRAAESVNNRKALGKRRQLENAGKFCSGRGLSSRDTGKQAHHICCGGLVQRGVVIAIGGSAATGDAEAIRPHALELPFRHPLDAQPQLGVEEVAGVFVLIKGLGGPCRLLRAKFASRRGQTWRAGGRKGRGGY